MQELVRIKHKIVTWPGCWPGDLIGDAGVCDTPLDRARVQSVLHTVTPRTCHTLPAPTVPLRQARRCAAAAHSADGTCRMVPARGQARAIRTSSCGRWCWYSAQAMAARAHARHAAARPPSASRPRRAAAAASSRARAFTRPSSPSTAVALCAYGAPRAACAWCGSCKSRAADQARMMRPRAASAPGHDAARCILRALHTPCMRACRIAGCPSPRAAYTNAAPRHRRASSGGARGGGARALASCVHGLNRPKQNPTQPCEGEARARLGVLLGAVRHTGGAARVGRHEPGRHAHVHHRVAHLHGAQPGRSRDL